ncbi:MAG TPA: amidohydrolase family protein [Vicinamibacterales bacterium]|nr:amidohydrolase family protein [Vicinamibacterales bacterium]
MKYLAVVTGLTVASLLVVVSAQQPAQRFDLLIKNGRVFDGSGNPWFPADIAVAGGRIVAVGRLGEVQAGRVIDASGKYVSPGFIDIHSHADDGSGPRGGLRDPDPARRAAPNLVSQGITTVVVNQDGRSPWPLTDQRSHLEKNGIGPNAMLLVGHGTVRRSVMGDDVKRPARPDEITRMRALVREALQQGAVGMSAGLEYEPGRWSTTEEVTELAKELPAFNGVYISHERSEGSDPLWYVPSQDGPTAPTLLDAVRETIEIGEKSGARVVASHLKAKGEHYWGSSAAAVTLIQRARDRGVDVWADQYPYPTSGTDGSTVLIPAWATRPPGAGPNQPPTNRADVLRRVLGDPSSAKLVRSDIAHEIRRRGGAENITVYEYTDKTLYGKSLAEIARLWKLDAVETAIKIQLEGLTTRNGGARMRGFSMAEIDMETIAKQPWVATSTDGGIALPADGPQTHARFYGSFTRKIRHYALDRGAITLESAIRSATSLPARIMDLKDRGHIREGFAADLIVFDLATIRDKATFFEPHQHSEGIDHVFINGIAVVDAGKLTGATPGRVLTR